MDLTKVPADIDIDCPRCQKPVTVRLYGPCESCCIELRASQAGEKSELVAAEYVPNMNVTPNAVASKE